MKLYRVVTQNGAVKVATWFGKGKDAQDFAKEKAAKFASDELIDVESCSLGVPEVLAALNRETVKVPDDNIGTVIVFRGQMK